MELKTLGEADMGLLLNLEIVRGKAEHVQPAFYDPRQGVGATTAQTLRLAQPWFGSDRVVAGACSVLCERACSQIILCVCASILHCIAAMRPHVIRCVRMQSYS